MTDAQAGTPISVDELMAKAPNDWPLGYATTLLGLARSLERTVEELRHDIARHVEIATEQAGEIERLLREVAELKAGLEASDTLVESLRLDAEQASARCAELERGEFICKQCGLRKDAEHEPADF